MGSSEEIDFSVTNGRGGWVPYRYWPSVPAAATFGVIFAICAAIHIFRLFKYKGWYFIPFIIGVMFESGGYFARIASSNDFYALSPYIAQSMLLLLAPPLFAASIYMTLSRLAIALHAEHLLAIRAKWLTTFFVTGDVLSFFTQSGGGGLMAAGSADKADIGQKMVTAGLFIQIFFFGGFIIISFLFHSRLNKSKSHAQEKVQGRKYLLVMYAASILILIRSIFRVAEYVMPHDGPLLSHEYYLYIFDGSLMIITVVLYLVIMPYGNLFDEWKRRKDAGDLEMSRRTDTSDASDMAPSNHA